MASTNRFSSTGQTVFIGCLAFLFFLWTATVSDMLDKMETAQKIEITEESQEKTPQIISPVPDETLILLEHRNEPKVSDAVVVESLVGDESTANQQLRKNQEKPVVASEAVSGAQTSEIDCTCGRTRGRHAKTCPLAGRWTEQQRQKFLESEGKSKIDLQSALTPEATVNYTVMGEAVFDMTTSTLTLLLGPEWQPSKPDEKTMVVSALGKFFESKKYDDIPPGMMLTLVLVAYALPRFTQPSTKSKMVNGWMWLKSKVFPMFQRKPKMIKVQP